MHILLTALCTPLIVRVWRICFSQTIQLLTLAIIFVILITHLFDNVELIMKKQIFVIVGA